MSATFIPLPPPNNRRKDNGRNSHAEDILAIINDVILPNYASFSLKDALSLLASKDIEKSEIAAVFESFTAQLVREGKIKPATLFENSFIVENA